MSETTYESSSAETPAGPPPVPPAVPPAAPPTVPPAAPQPPKQRFVERLWGFRSLLAVAIASVVIGGLGGAAIAKAGGDHGDGGFGPGRGGFRGGPNGGFGPGRGFQRSQPGQQGPGQLGPGQQAPQQQAPSPSPSSSTSG